MIFFYDISNDINLWFDTSNYIAKLPRSLPIGKNTKILGKFKDELGGKIISELCCLKAKTYSNKSDEDSKCKYCNINDEIKNNTKELNKIDNSDIIPKNYNTKAPFKNNINNENVINEIIANNVDIYSDSANSACIDIINCIDAYIDNTKCTTIVIIKSTNTHTNNIKITIIDIIKSIIAFIYNLNIIVVYIIRIINNKTNNIKNICYAKIKSSKYLNSKKGKKHLDSIKSICHDKIKSTNADNSIKSTCVDKIKAYIFNASTKNNITTAHKKVKWEVNMLSKN